MKNELIKIEKCDVENCSTCNRCVMIFEESRKQAADANTDGGLYNREAEQYYFYFLESKAS